MKRIISLLVAVLMAFCVVMPISADEVTDESSLRAAIAGGDATIVLNNDVELTSKLVIDRSVTIDLNNNSITGSDSFVKQSDNALNHLIEITASDVTVKNGSLVAGPNNNHVVNVWAGTDGLTGVNLSDLILDHSKAYRGAPLVVTRSEVTLGGTMEFVAGDNSWYAINVDPRETSATLNAEDDLEVVFDSNDKALLAVDTDVEKADVKTFTAKEGLETIISSDGQVLFDTEEKVNNLAVASDNNGKLYATLQDAFDNVENNGTITLLKDSIDLENFININEPKTVTLDLNNHKFKSNSDMVLQVAIQNVDVKIKGGYIENSVGGRSLILLNSSSVTGKDNIKLTIDGVKMVSNSTFGITNNGLDENVEIKISNSSLVCTEEMSLGLYLPAKDSLTTIENSSIEAGVGIGIKGGEVKIINTDIHAILNDDGSTVDKPASGGINTIGSAVYVEGGYDWEANVTIDGGNFVSDHADALTMKFVEEDEDTAPKKLEVSGGTFSDDSALNYLANDNGELAVASVNDGTTTTYAIGKDSIQEAATNADANTKIEITQGSVDLTDVPDGVEVSNTGKGNVTVNDQEVTDTPVVTHTHEWELKSVNFAEDNSKADFLFVCTKDETHTQTVSDNELDFTRVEPTVDKEGKETYTATVTLEGKEYSKTKEVILDKLSPEEPEITAPTITTGKNLSFTLGSKDTLTFTSDAEYKDFLKVLVDGKELAKENYTVKEGSTVVTLSNSYLNTLSVGDHVLSIVSNNGTATTTFKVVKGATSEVVVPDTGIGSNMMYASLAVMLMTVLGASLIVYKKKLNNK